MKRFLPVHIGLFVLVIFYITGCTTKPVTPPTQATLQTRDLQPSAGKALVYYYNDKIFFNAPLVSLDGASSQFSRNTYVVWEVNPGKHHLEFQRSGLASLTSAETVKLEITCESDQTYYFYMQGYDRDTHKIVQADEQAGRAKIEKFSLAGWFKDGVQVSEPEKK